MSTPSLEARISAIEALLTRIVGILERLSDERQGETR